MLLYYRTEGVLYMSAVVFNILHCSNNECFRVISRCTYRGIAVYVERLFYQVDARSSMHAAYAYVQQIQAECMGQQ